MRIPILLAVAAVCAFVVVLGQVNVNAGAGTIADVVYSDCTSISNWGAVGGIRGYSLGSHTCNIGTENLLWGVSNSGTPVLGMNAYRLDDGRLVQIGMSFAKHGTGAAAGNGCGLTCNGMGGSVLGIGCRDVYGSGFNGTQGILGPRSEVNAYTGDLAPAPGGSGDEIFRRLQIAEADLDAAAHPDALYFVEGVYVALDDAAVFDNGYNNASHKRAVVEPDLDISVTGSMQIGVPAIVAWEEHGGGVGVPDPDVNVTVVDVPGEGRFYLAAKATATGGGQWQYEYALFNLNSHRSAAWFNVPVPSSVAATSIGFHDVDYHSGEVYDNTDWGHDSGVRWSSPQTFEEDPNTNALWWGTMYNFWFTAEAPPENGTGRIGLFRPGTPSTLSVGLPVPTADCFADLDDSGDVGFSDLLLLLGAWGPCSGCPEDIDESGDVGFSDLLVVLGRWGECS